MPVFRGSRYEGSKFTAIIGKDGKTRKFLHSRTALKLDQMQDPITFHPFQNGEVIDEYAWKACGQSLLWWAIAEVSGIMFPLDIEPGTEISVPHKDLMDHANFE